MSEERNEAHLLVSHRGLVAPVLSRVVGMLAARAQCPIDRLDDALLLADALAAHVPHFSPDGRVEVSVRTDEAGLDLLVDGLRPARARDLVAAAELPGVGNVLQKVADEVQVSNDDSVRVRLGFA